LITILRPLSTSELLDRTFHLYRNNFLLFVGITAIPQLLVLALRLAAPRHELPDLEHPFNYMGSLLAVGIGSLGAIEIAHAATVVAVSNLHLGRPATIASSFSAAKSSLLRVVGISLAAISIAILIAILFAVMASALVIFAFMPFSGLASNPVTRFLPLLMVVCGVLVGLRWWIAWALVVPVTVLEGAGLRGTIRRSRELTEGSRGRILVIYLLMAVLAGVITIAIHVPLLAIFGVIPFRASPHLGFSAYAVRTAGTFLATSLVGALGTIALTLVYYDLRVRKEGFDLQLMMSNLKSESQPAPASVS
jgi:hypothetical protein